MWVQDPPPPCLAIKRLREDAKLHPAPPTVVGTTLDTVAEDETRERGKPEEEAELSNAPKLRKRSTHSMM